MSKLPATQTTIAPHDGVISFATLRAAFDGAFSVEKGVLRVKWRNVEIMPGYNAKRPFDLKRPDDARLYAMIEHNRFDDTLPIVIAANLVEKKLYLVRGHSRLAIAALLDANKSDSAVDRIACTVIDHATWDDARFTRDVSVSNLVRGQDDAELGMTIRRLLSQKVAKAEILASLGIDRKKYDQAVKASTADTAIVAMMKAGMSSSFYTKLVSAHGVDLAAKMLADTAAAKAKAGDKTPVTPANVAPHEAARTGGTKVTGRGKTTGTGRGSRTAQVHARNGKGPAVQVAPPTLPPVDKGTPAPGVTLEGPYSVGPKAEICEGKDKLAVGYGASEPWARAMVDVLNAARRAGIMVRAGKLITPPAAVAPSNVVPMVAPPVKASPAPVPVRAAAKRMPAAPRKVARKGRK